MKFSIGDIVKFKLISYEDEPDVNYLNSRGPFKVEKIEESNDVVLLSSTLILHKEKCSGFKKLIVGYKEIRVNEIYLQEDKLISQKQNYINFYDKKIFKMKI